MRHLAGNNAILSRGVFEREKRCLKTGGVPNSIISLCSEQQLGMYDAHSHTEVHFPDWRGTQYSHYREEVSRVGPVLFQRFKTKSGAQGGLIHQISNAVIQFGNDFRPSQRAQASQLRPLPVRTNHHFYLRLYNSIFSQTFDVCHPRLNTAHPTLRALAQSLVFEAGLAMHR